MKYINRILFIFLALFALNSCGDDTVAPEQVQKSENIYFEFSKDQVFSYQTLNIDGADTILSYNYKLHTQDPILLNGKNAYQLVQVREGETLEESVKKGDFVYANTDKNGLYLYYDKFPNQYSDFFPELNNIWVKRISFTEKNWTVVDLKLDSNIVESNSQMHLVVKLDGERVGDTTIVFNGVKHKAIITRSNIYTNMTLVNENQETYEDKYEMTDEIISVDGIGIYKIQRLKDGVYKDYFDIMTDIK